MPVRPRKNETQAEFIQRCVKVEIDSGKDQDQAVAICYSIWEKKSVSSNGKASVSKTDDRGSIPLTGAISV